MKDCCDCGRKTKKGYAYYGKFRCDECHMDYIRRWLRNEETNPKLAQDRHRKPMRHKHDNN